MLRLEGVIKSFGGKRAVDQVSLVVPAGQLLGVIGQSGSGKSTLLRMINRLGDPTAGQIRFGDTDVTALRGRALRQWRARCAMIFQQFNLAGRLDVLTNVMMGRAFHVPPTRALLKLWTDSEKAMGLSALEGLDMARLAGQRADTLSGGQQQRVAIARALVQEPEIILADEPIASLDPRNTQVVMDALQHINRHFGITVICNLHSLDLARKYCDRLVGLAAGKVVFDGAPAALTEHGARDLYGLEAADVLGHAAPPDFVSPSPASHWPGPDRYRPSQQGDLPMFTRRLVLGSALAAGALILADAAHAQDWKAKYPELVMAVVPAENASGVTERYAPFVEYLSKELGTKVTLRVANDYAAVIEGQRNGSIQIAGYGPASYARAVVTGVKVEPFATTVNNDGTIGYYSVFYVRADSPYKSIEDLKGKNLGLVDPNSTSGNNVPRFLLNKQKIVPETYFSHVTYTGSHENAVSGAAAEDRRCRRQLVERRGRFEPHAHGVQGAGQEGRLPHHLQVRPDPQLALRLSRRPAARPEGRHRQGLRRRADQGQGRLRQAVGRQGPRVHQGRCQGLRARRRADQVRRFAAQAEELIAAAATLT